MASKKRDALGRRRRPRFDIPKSELKQLAELYSDAKIGEKYGVCAEVIRRRRLEYGIKPGKRRAFDPAPSVLKRLYQKHSMREIAEQFDVGETVVWKRLKEHGIKLKGFEEGGHRAKPGRRFSEDHLKKIRKAAKKRRGKYTGPNSPNWKGGLSEINGQARRTGAYKEWKNTALERAGYRCQQCGVEHRTACKCCGTRVSLHVHHIKPFAKHPELRFSQRNAQVLCPKCHQCHH